MKIVKIKETEYTDLVKFKRPYLDKIMICILTVKDILVEELKYGRKSIGVKESVLIINVF